MADTKDFDFNLGGRLYDKTNGSYQNLSKSERREITINGEETCDIDIRACHLTICYGALGSNALPEGDPYEHADIPRDIIKPYTSALLSEGKLLAKMPQEIKAKYETDTGEPFPKGITGKVLSTEILKMHPILVNLQDANVNWGTLQYLESEAMLQTLEALALEGVVALPMHDGLIVAMSHRALAEKILSERFEEVCGIKPTLTVS